MKKKFSLSLIGIIGVGLMATSGCVSDRNSEPTPPATSSSSAPSMKPTPSASGPWDNKNSSATPTPEVTWAKETTQYASTELPDSLKKQSEGQWESTDGKTTVIFSDVPATISGQGLDSVLKMMVEQASGSSSSDSVKTFPTSTPNSTDARNIKINDPQNYGEGVIAEKGNHEMTLVLVVSSDKDTFDKGEYKRIIDSFTLS